MNEQPSSRVMSATGIVPKNAVQALEALIFASVFAHWLGDAGGERDAESPENLFDRREFHVFAFFQANQCFSGYSVFIAYVFYRI